jgi:hypothetical protein
MGYPELRLRSAPEAEGMQSLDEDCGELVEQRIRAFLM